jgi:hypothetical protein
MSNTQPRYNGPGIMVVKDAVAAAVQAVPLNEGA